MDSPDERQSSAKLIPSVHFRSPENSPAESTSAMTITLSTPVQHAMLTPAAPPSKENSEGQPSHFHKFSNEHPLTSAHGAAITGPSGTLDTHARNEATVREEKRQRKKEEKRWKKEEKQARKEALRVETGMCNFVLISIRYQANKGGEAAETEDERRRRKEKSRKKEEKGARKEAKHLERGGQNSGKRQWSPTPTKELNNQVDTTSPPKDVSLHQPASSEPKHKKKKINVLNLLSEEMASKTKRKHGQPDSSHPPDLNAAANTPQVSLESQHAKRRKLELSTLMPAVAIKPRSPPLSPAIAARVFKNPHAHPTNRIDIRDGCHMEKGLKLKVREDPLSRPEDGPGPPLSEDADDASEDYGPPIQLEYPFKGCCLTDAEVQELEASYERQSANYPAVFQQAFKHTAHGRLDKHAHLWLIPRLYNYYHSRSREQRTALLNRIIQDLVAEFPDLHPNFLKLCDVVMENKYLDSLRNVVFVAIGGIKSTLENPSKIENIDKDMIKRLTGTTLPPRPHDLWASTELAKIQDRPDTAPATAPGKEGSSQQVPNLKDDWKAFLEEAKKTQGAEAGSKHRLKLQQEFRKLKFGQLPEAEQQIYIDGAKASNKPIDPVTALVSGLPFLNLVNRVVRVSRWEGGIGLREGEEDSYSPAPSNVPDFLNGPDQLGAKIVIPAFCKFVAQCYDSSPDDVVNMGISLPSVTIDDELESGLADEEGPLPNLKPMYPKTGGLTRLGIQFTVTPRSQGLDCRFSRAPGHQEEHQSIHIGNFQWF
ncbi:hypothetical protein FRC00_011930 [Tulasnella sp. 408]|nr:hypothetical protein FRC00_011930 [Tulasnella sp. 408]